MANGTSSTILSFLSIVVLVVGTAPANDATGLPFIIKSCNSAYQQNGLIDLDVCINAFKAIPESYSVDLKGLLEISHRLALTQSVACEPLLQTPLGICHSFFAGISAALKLSASFCAAGNFLGIEKTLALGAGINLCQGGLRLIGRHEFLIDNILYLRQLVLITQALSICIGGGDRNDDPDSGHRYSSPPPAIPYSSPPPPPAVTYHSPPPPSAVSHHSPPPPTDDSSRSPPPVVTYHSPPPPADYSSTPPAVPSLSPPPPAVSYRSPPPPILYISAPAVHYRSPPPPASPYY